MGFIYRAFRNRIRKYEYMYLILTYILTNYHFNFYFNLFCYFIVDFFLIKFERSVPFHPESCVILLRDVWLSEARGTTKSCLSFDRFYLNRWGGVLWWDFCLVCLRNCELSLFFTPFSVLSNCSVVNRTELPNIKKYLFEMARLKRYKAPVETISDTYMMLKAFKACPLNAPTLRPGVNFPLVGLSSFAL